MHYYNFYTGQLYDGISFQQFINAKIFSNKLHFLKDQILGETAEGIEVKMDNRRKETRNFYIESAERRDPSTPYFASGIFRGDNTWLWVIGDTTEVFLVKKDVLVDECNLERWPVIENSYETSIGYLLPETRMEEICAVKIWPDRMDDELRNKLNSLFSGEPNRF